LKPSGLPTPRLPCAPIHQQRSELVRVHPSRLTRMQVLAQPAPPISNWCSFPEQPAKPKREPLEISASGMPGGSLTTGFRDPMEPMGRFRSQAVEVVEGGAHFRRQSLCTPQFRLLPDSLAVLTLRSIQEPTILRH